MLKPETEKTWHFLQGQPALSGFILLGGSALTMHLHHRKSEDLDLNEGFEALAPNAPSVADMRKFFQEQRDNFERSEAASAWRKKYAP